MVTKLKRLENKWNNLDSERDHITEEMQYIRKEILKIQNSQFNENQNKEVKK